jgi:hypothetical protein
MDFLNHLPALQQELTKLLQQSDSLAFYCHKTNKKIDIADFVSYFCNALQEKQHVYTVYFNVLYDYHKGTYNLANSKTLADTLINFYEIIWDLLGKDKNNISGLGTYFGKMFDENPSIFSKNQMNLEFFTDDAKPTTQQTSHQKRQDWHPFATEFKVIYDIRQWSQHRKSDLLEYKDDKIDLEQKRNHAAITEWCLLAYTGIALYYFDDLKRALDKQTEPSFTEHLIGLQKAFDDFAARYLLHGKKDSYIEQQIEVRPASAAKGTTIAAIIERNPLVMLRGEAGYGKTTALRKLAADAAQKAGNDRQQPIPIFVELPLLPTASLESYLAKMLNLTTGELEKLLRNKRLLLILDALNEVAQEKQADLKDVINRLAQHYRGLKIIVSARSNDKYTLKDFNTFIHFKALTRPQIDKFLHKECSTTMYDAIKQLPNKDAFYDMFKNAFILKIYVETLEKEGKPIENERTLLDTYIEQLFKREITEKSDTQFADNVPIFKYFLAYIANNIEEDEAFSDLQALDWISAGCKEKGYPNDPQHPTFVLQKAVELDILRQQENGYYQFRNQHYYNYFASQL